MSPGQERGKQNRSDSSVFAKVELENWEPFRRGGSSQLRTLPLFPYNYDIPTRHNTIWTPSFILWGLHDTSITAEPFIFPSSGIEK